MTKTMLKFIAELKAPKTLKTCPKAARKGYLGAIDGLISEYTRMTLKKKLDYSNCAISEENWQIECPSIDGWDSNYFKMQLKPTKNEFYSWSTKLPKFLTKTDPWLSADLWDQFIGDCAREENPMGLTEAESRVMTQVINRKQENLRTAAVITDMINKKERVRDIDMITLAIILGQLGVEDLLVCLYDNNTYFGCSVQKESNVGISRVSIRVLHEMFKAYLKNADNSSEMYDTLRNSPKNSIAGYFWREIELLENPKVKGNVIPKEDVKFWRSIYKVTKSHLETTEMVAGIELVEKGNDFVEINERAIGNGYTEVFEVTTTLAITLIRPDYSYCN